MARPPYTGHAMIDDPDDRPQLRCISCGYDLRGLPPEGLAQTAFQCPECGAVNELTAIIAEHQRRRLATRDLIRAALVGLAVTGVVVIGGLLLEPLNIRLNASAVALFLVVFVVSWMAVVNSYAISHLAAIIFATVAAAISAASMSIQIGRGAPVALLFFWVVGFINWAKAR